MNKQDIVLGNSPNNPIAEKPFYAWKKTKENFDDLYEQLQDLIDNGISIDISGKEDKTNKVTNFTILNDTLYPTVKAVKSLFDSFSNPTKTYYVIGSDKVLTTIEGNNNLVDSGEVFDGEVLCSTNDPITNTIFIGTSNGSIYKHTEGGWSAYLGISEFPIIAMKYGLAESYGLVIADSSGTIYGNNINFSFEWQYYGTIDSATIKEFVDDNSGNFIIISNLGIYTLIGGLAQLQSGNFNCGANINNNYIYIGSNDGHIWRNTIINNFTTFTDLGDNYFGRSIYTIEKVENNDVLVSGNFINKSIYRYDIDFNLITSISFGGSDNSAITKIKYLNNSRSLIGDQNGNVYLYDEDGGIHLLTQSSSISIVNGIEYTFIDNSPFEKLINKITDLNSFSDNITYPTTQAVNTKLSIIDGNISTIDGNISSINNNLLTKVDKFIGKGYGYLYNAYTVNTGNLAPTGWLVPTQTDYETLITYLGGVLSGGHLKEANTNHWDNIASGTDNNSNFTAVGSGTRNNIGNFNNLKYYGWLWTSTISGTSGNHFLYLQTSTNDSGATNVTNFKQGLGVRCFRTTDPGVSTITDIDGNIYDVIHIGTQWWLKQNLKVTHYNTGVAIPNITDTTEWSTLTTGAYCSYDNDESNALSFNKQLSTEDFTTSLKNKLTNLFTTSLVLKDFSNDVILNTVIENDFYSETIVANTLINNNDKLIFNVFFDFTNSPTNSYIKLYFAGTSLVWINNNTLSGYGHVTFTIIRISSTICRLFIVGEGSTLFNNYIELTGKDFTIDNIIKITGSCSTNNMIARFGYIEYKPSA